MAWLRQAVGAMAVCFLILAVPALPAAAHSPLASSSPADGDSVTAAPRTIEMTFRGTARLVRLALSGALSGEVDLGDGHLMIEKQRHTVSLPEIRPDEYEVRWRALSADGHVVKGSFSFTVEAE